MNGTRPSLSYVRLAEQLVTALKRMNAVGSSITERQWMEEDRLIMPCTFSLMAQFCGYSTDIIGDLLDRGSPNAEV